MARPKKSKQSPKQGPPIAFRPGPDLALIVENFATKRHVSIHEAFKQLAALAAIGLDVRYYDLVAEAAVCSQGSNSFVRVALQVRTALLTMFRQDPKFARDPMRTQVVIKTVEAQVVETGGALKQEVVRSLLSMVNRVDDRQILTESEEEKQEIPVNNYQWNE